MTALEDVMLFGRFPLVIAGHYLGYLKISGLSSHDINIYSFRIVFGRLLICCFHHMVMFGGALVDSLALPHVFRVW